MEAHPLAVWLAGVPVNVASKAKKGVAAATVKVARSVPKIRAAIAVLAGQTHPPNLVPGVLGIRTEAVRPTEELLKRSAPVQVPVVEVGAIWTAIPTTGAVAPKVEVPTTSVVLVLPGLAGPAVLAAAAVVRPIPADQEAQAVSRLAVPRPVATPVVAKVEGPKAVVPREAAVRQSWQAASRTTATLGPGLWPGQTVGPGAAVRSLGA